MFEQHDHDSRTAGVHQPEESVLHFCSYAADGDRAGDRHRGADKRQHDRQQRTLAVGGLRSHRTLAWIGPELHALVDAPVRGFTT